MRANSQSESLAISAALANVTFPSRSSVRDFFRNSNSQRLKSQPAHRIQMIPNAYIRDCDKSKIRVKKC